MQIHCLAPPTLVFLGHLEQVADVGDLTTGGSVVGLHGDVADLLQAQSLGSRLVLGDATIQALDQLKCSD